jgi:hypothetical protein
LFPLNVVNRPGKASLCNWQMFLEHLHTFTKTSYWPTGLLFLTFKIRNIIEKFYMYYVHHHRAKKLVRWL